MFEHFGPAAGRVQPLIKFIASALLLIFLFLGKPILLPIALAAFLATLLTPLVVALQRRRIPRVIAVVAVILVVAIGLGGILVLLGSQLLSLIEDLPTYTDNIKAKIRSIRGVGDSMLFRRLDYMWTEIRAEWAGESPTFDSQTANPQPPAGEEEPVPVKVQEEGPIWASNVPDYLAPVLGGVVTFGLAIVLAIFFLMHREAIRDRVIRLAGGVPVVMTKAADEAGARIGRYLRMQLAVNTTYGVLWGAGLYLIGLHYALLWGFFAAILRFVPYVGPWVSAIVPLTLATAQFEGWTQLVIIFGLIAALELLTNNFLEPVLYGRSTGVSDTAMLISAAFWTFLWGPIGLVLSGPITVCLAVIGNRFPQFKFLDLLLGDGPVLDPHISFYHRLVARDPNEARSIVEECGKCRALDALLDELLIPALNAMKLDRLRAGIDQDDEAYVVKETRSIVQELAQANGCAGNADGAKDGTDSRGTGRVRALGFPARDSADQLAAEMLLCLLDAREWDVEIAPAGSLTGEWIEQVEANPPSIVFIAALPPGDDEHERYVCKKLRREHPNIRIAVGRWGRTDMDEIADSEATDHADQIATSLRQTRDQLNGWLPVFAQEQRKRLEVARVAD